MDKPISPAFEDELRAAVAAPAAPPEFVSVLRADLLARAAGKRPRFFLRPAWRWALVICLLLLIAFLAIGPGRVIAAFRGLFGYVPGAGIVSQEAPLRTIAAPVTVEGEGATLTVTQVLLTADKTIIRHKVWYLRELIPAESTHLMCDLSDSLRLPDGTVMQSTNGSGAGDVRGYYWDDTFGPIPAEVNDAVLVVYCPPDAAPGDIPLRWEVPLHFVPLPPDAVYPVFEISPAPEATGTLGQTLSFATPTRFEISPAPEATGMPRPADYPLSLENYIEVEDGYILAGRYRAVKPEGLEVTSLWYPGPPRFTDASGQRLRALDASDAYPPYEDRFSFPWAFHIQGKHHAWPLTITLDSMDVNVAMPAVVVLEFDTGPAPQAGQVWRLNQDIALGNYPLRLLTITRNPDGYGFVFEADKAIRELTLSIQGYQHLEKHGEDMWFRVGEELSTNRLYAGEVPEGKLAVVLSGARVTVNGPWSVQWMPPGEAASTPITPAITLTPTPLGIAHTPWPTSIYPPLNRPAATHWFRTPDLTKPGTTCAGKFTRLVPGGEARPLTSPGRNIRLEPAAWAKIVARVDFATTFDVLEGPVCADGLAFWKVRADLLPGVTGWVAEGDGVNYWLEPLKH